MAIHTKTRRLRGYKVRTVMINCRPEVNVSYWAESAWRGRGAKIKFVSPFILQPEGMNLLSLLT